MDSHCIACQWVPEVFCTLALLHDHAITPHRHTLRSHRTTWTHRRPVAARSRGSFPSVEGFGFDYGVVSPGLQTQQHLGGTGLGGGEAVERRGKTGMCAGVSVRMHVCMYVLVPYCD